MVTVAGTSLSMQAAYMFKLANERNAAMAAASAGEAAAGATSAATAQLDLMLGDSDAALAAVHEAQTFAFETAELYERGELVLRAVRAQQRGVLRLFGLALPFDDSVSDYVRTTEVEDSGGATASPALPSTGDGSLVDVVTDLVPDALVAWAAGDAAPDFTGANQLGGPLTFTASARFDDLSAGGWQRIFDFGNGPFADNILVTQEGTSNNLVFHIHQGGSQYEVRADNAIVEGERAVWTARVDESGAMSIFKDGRLLAASLGLAGAQVASVDRSSNLIGESNWAGDTDLVGAVYGLEVHGEALSNDEIEAMLANGDPWA
ncbi:LamG domain-containing protein [Acuticoccus sp. I52.16.1]|uniref:LamG domain-containing protein n=1 Tax=Acuticoccus sp. I52.16.1 TaxID=2928472 RepID=UPI001FD114EF|nr:LamG domain-containing protein [Acuticoccus sp. I52.16.1]UOM33741.1 LamG domain-containing protein [Acuticoccus sp. I52.16.1]